MTIWNAGYRSDYELTRTRYTTPSRVSYGVFKCEYFGEKWLCYKEFDCLNNIIIR